MAEKIPFNILKDIAKENDLHISQCKGKFYLYRTIGTFDTREAFQEVLLETAKTPQKEKLSYSQLARASRTSKNLAKAFAYRIFLDLFTDIGVTAPVKMADYVANNFMNRYETLCNAKNTPKIYTNLSTSIEAVCYSVLEEYEKDPKLKRIHRGLFLTDILSYKSVLEAYCAKERT